MKEQVVRSLSRVFPNPAKHWLGRMAAARVARLRASSSFSFRGREYPYCCDLYNMAWCNERTVEIPVIWELVQGAEPSRTLEVGNVLSHYYPVEHDVLDKYERADRVINEDVVTFKPGREYDLIVSISTLEHVGSGASPPRSGKFAEAVDNLVSLLAPGGLLAVTLPAGQNPEADAALESEDGPFDEAFCLARVSRFNDWDEIPFSEAFSKEGILGLYGASRVCFCFARKGGERLE